MQTAWSLWLALLTILISASTLTAQISGDFRSNTTSGNWATNGSWQTYNGAAWVAASSYPGQNSGTRTVTIRDGHTITLDVSPANAIGGLTVGGGTSGTLAATNSNYTLTVTNNFISNANSSFNLRRITFTVNGTSTINGTVTDNNNNGSCLFAGLVTVNNGGSISTTNSSAFSFRGGLANNGTVNLTGGNAIAFTTNNQSLSGNGAITMNGTVTVTGVIVTNSNTNLNFTSTSNGTLSGNGTWRQGTNGVLKYSGGTITVNTVDFNTNLNTVEYARAGNQTVYSTPYRNLSISGSGTKTLAGAITINRNLDISGTATLACDIYQITGNATGTLTMGSGSVLTLGRTSNAANVLFPTNFTNANITLNSGSTVTYQNNSTQTVSSIPVYGGLTIATGGTKTINGNTTVGGNLTISAGTLNLGTVATTFTVNGTATITGTLSSNGTTTKTITINGNLGGGGTINLSGGSLLHNLNLDGANNAIGTFTTAAVASTVTYTRAGAQQVFGSVNYRNLTTSGSGTKSMTATVTVNNTFTIGSGTSFDPVGNSITVNGNSVFAGTFAESNTGGTNTFQNVNLSGGTINGSVTDVTNINGALSVSTGNGTIGRTTLTVAGTTTVATGRTLNLNNNNGVKTFVGEVTIDGSGTWNSTTITTANNLVFRGGIDVSSSSGSFSVAVATFNTNSQTLTGLGPVSFSGAVAITGAITVTNTNTNRITFNNTLNGSAAGSTWRNGTNGITYYQPGATTQPMNTGTLDVSATGNFFYYSRAGAQNIKAPASSYYNLYITGGSSSTKTLQGNTSVGGSFLLDAATNFDPGAYDFTVSGTSTIAGTFADGNATGTSNLQDVDLSGGTINNSGVTGVMNINGNLTIPSSNGTIGRITLTVAGTTSIATGRTLTFNANSNTGVKIFTGGITLDGTGAWASTNISTAANLDIRGGIDVTSSGGSFAAGAATFSTGSQSLSGAGPITFANDVIVSGAIVVTNTNTNGITFNNIIDGTVAGSTWRNGAGGVTYYQPGAATQPMNTGALDMSAAGNFFYYSRAGAQNVKAPSTSYYHLSLTGSGIKTVQNNTTVDGNLSIAASASLDVSSFNISVAGTTALDGAFTDADDSGTNTFTGLLTISATGALSASGASPFVFAGGITNNGTFNQSGAGAISFITNNQDISGNAAMAFAGAVTIQAGRTVTYKNTNAGGITLSGVLNGGNAASTWKNDVNSTVYYQPSVSAQPMSTGILDVAAAGNNFYYSGTGVQALKIPSAGYYNLIINGGGVTKTLGGNTIVENNLTIAPTTTLDVNAAQNYSLEVKGNFINSGTFLAQNGTVTLSGSSDQAVTSGTGIFYNLVIANTGTQVSINDDLSISNSLTLTDGVVTTSSNHVIILSASASALSGHSSASFINGSLRRSIAANTSTYAFPVGNGTAASNYFLAEIVNNNLSGITHIDSRFKPLANHNDNQMDVSDVWEEGSLNYTTIHTAGVWELEPNAIPSGGAYSVKLYIENMPGLVDNEFGVLKRPVGSMTGAAWTTGGGSLNTNDAPGRTVAGGFVKRNGLTSFSEFGVGEGTGSGVGLPIELLSFEAAFMDEAVRLSWITATEVNNDFFTVERSEDGKIFKALSVFEGAGHSSVTNSYQTYDRDPFTGVSYYRLKQTDFDGASTYSAAVAVEVMIKKATLALRVYPNPVRDGRLFIKPENLVNDNAAASVEVLNTAGAQVYFESIILNGASAFPIHLPATISPGMYLVVMNIEGKSFRHTVMITQ